MAEFKAEVGKNWQKSGRVDPLWSRKSTLREPAEPDQLSSVNGYPSS